MRKVVFTIFLKGIYNSVFIRECIEKVVFIIFLKGIYNFSQMNLESLFVVFTVFFKGTCNRQFFTYFQYKKNNHG